MSGKYKKTISSFGIQGYRSFGPTPQFFPKFAQINLFIGQNNSGKSNVLYGVHRLLPKLIERKLVLDKLDSHIPAAEFSFFLAVPTMLGATIKKSIHVNTISSHRNTF